MTTIDERIELSALVGMTNIIKMGEGYRDFYNKRIRAGGDGNKARYYIKEGDYGYDYAGNLFQAESADLNFIYDRTTGIVRDVVDPETATLAVCYRPYQFQEGGSIFDAYFETTNIFFNKDKFEDSIIKAFVKTTASLSGTTINYTSDGNYNFDSDKIASIPTGEITITGSWSNDPLYFDGTRKYYIHEISIQQKDSSSIRFMVKASMNSLDVHELYSIELTNAGLIFSEADNA